MHPYQQNWILIKHVFLTEELRLLVVTCVIWHKKYCFFSYPLYELWTKNLWLGILLLVGASIKDIIHILAINMYDKFKLTHRCKYYDVLRRVKHRQKNQSPLFPHTNKNRHTHASRQWTWGFIAREHFCSHSVMNYAWCQRRSGYLLLWRRVAKKGGISMEVHLEFQFLLPTCMLTHLAWNWSRICFPR